MYVNGAGSWTDTGYTLPTSPFYLAVYTNGTNGFYVYVNGNLEYHYTSVSGDNGNLEVGSTTEYGGNSGNQFFGAFGDIKYSTTQNLTQPSMPTFTIGTESVYQANATTTSSFSGSPTGSYNSTYVYDTYNIPIAPSTGYVSVVYNSTWTVSNIYPSTYLPLIPGSDFLTVEDVTGFGSIQVTFIEPSQQIGSTTFDTISYAVPPGMFMTAGQTTNRITYTPFGSSAVTSESTTTTSFQAPYGSTVSIDVINQWQQSIGSISGYLLFNSSSQITIPLDVTQLNFEFENSSAQYVYLSANGYNISAFNSAIVANNSFYSWSTQYYSLASGQAQYKNGNVSTDAPQMPVFIYLDTPPAELQVSVAAYNGSNLGSITSSGNPRVQVYIDSQPYSIGSTFVGYMGYTYHIQVMDLLNQTLVQGNITLVSSFTSIVEVIPVPSYTLGIENEESVSTTSPLATEHVEVNSTSGSTYSFTDGIGQNTVLYLKSGTYHVYMHDNLTGNFNIDLTQNSQLYAFGQSLLNYTDFQNAINRLLNDTSGLSLATLASSSGIEPGQFAIYSLAVNYINGTAVSQSFLQNSTIDVLVHNNQNGQAVSMTTATQVQGNTLSVTLTPSSTGSYEISIIVIHGSLSGQASYALLVQAVVVQSNGMVLDATGPSDVQEYLTWNYTITVDYANGSAMNLHDTRSVYDNLSTTIFNGIDPVQQIQKISYGAGYIFINVTFNQTGGFTLYITSYANLNGYASGTALVPITVYAESIMPITSQIASNTQIIVSTSNTMMVGLEYQNGSYLSASLTHLFYANATVNLYLNGLYYGQVTPSSYSASVIFFDINISQTGNFTFDFLDHANGLSTLAVSHTDVVRISPSKEGLRMSIAGSNQMYTGQASNYTISLEYSNRTALNLADTRSVYDNLTFEVLNGLDPAYNVKLLGYTAGLIFVTYSSNLTGVYTLYFQSYASLDGYASDTVIFPVSIENITYALHVSALSPSESLIPGENANIIYSIAYADYSPVSKQFLQNASYRIMITNQLGAVYLNYTVSVSAGNLTLVVLAVPAGNYTLALTVTSGRYSGSGFYSFSSVPLAKVSNGLSFIVLPPVHGEVEVQTSGNLTLLAEYRNGTLLNLSDSQKLLTGKYLVVLLFRNNQLIGPMNAVLSASGKFLLPYDFATVANYTVVVTAQGVPIGRANTSASTYLMIAAVPFNPVSPPLTGLNAIIYGIINNVSIVLGIILGVSALVYGIYRIIRKRQIKKETLRSTYDNIVRGIAMYEHLKKDSELIFANIPTSITETVMGDVVYPQAKWDGLNYVMSGTQHKKIEKERQKGVVK